MGEEYLIIEEKLVLEEVKKILFVVCKKERYT